MGFTVEACGRGCQEKNAAYKHLNFYFFYKLFFLFFSFLRERLNEKIFFKLFFIFFILIELKKNIFVFYKTLFRQNNDALFRRFLVTKILQTPNRVEAMQKFDGRREHEKSKS